MRRSAVIASLLLVVSSSAAFAQGSLLLRLGGEPGQFNKYQGIMETFIRGGQMASMMSSDTTLPMSRITTFTTRTLLSLDADTLVYSEVIDSLRFESPAMPQMAAMAGAAVSQMQGQTTTTRTNARGRIFSAEVTNPNAMAAGGGGRGMGGGAQRTLFLLPENPVRIGDSWNDSMMVTGASPNEPSTNMVATFRLERVDNRGGIRVAVISINGTMAQVSAQTGPTRLSVSGEFQLDVTNHRLAGVNMTMAGTMNSPQSGEVPIRMQVTQSLMP